MDEITLKNYRCFREEQVARMAPLTLLVGENSTGKTSFLAMLRILWDIAAGMRAADFKEPPYDLGSFEEIAYHRYGQSEQPETFEAGLSLYAQPGREAQGIPFDKAYHQSITFGKSGTVPFAIRKYFSYGDIAIDMKIQEQEGMIYVQTHHGKWEGIFPLPSDREPQLVPHYDVTNALNLYRSDDRNLKPVSGTSARMQPDLTEINQEFLMPISFYFIANPLFWKEADYRPFASAPVRSKPHRTYDPARIVPDAEGDYVPMYLADVFFRQSKSRWETLKHKIEEFGKDSGMFDEITIKALSRRESDPFQIQIRKFGNGTKGRKHNLIDVGYGVSQVLPVITELLRPDGPRMFLMQQPEVHLHPSAQAALGSLFCTVAATDRQIVVETHSDHLLDRVRMDVRDRKTKLKPEDVSILYFERTGLDVTIHSIRIDEQGNIIDAPNGYRQFFMEETARSLGL